MKLLRAATALLTISTLFGLPVMACVAPAASLTQEEKSCCEAMQNKCDEMGMSHSSHSCCQPKTTPAARPFVAQVRIAHTNPVPAIAAAVFPPLKLFLQARFELALRNNLDPSPPGARSNSILRI